MNPDEYYEIAFIQKQLDLDKFTEKQIAEIRANFNKAAKDMFAYAKKKKHAKFGEGGWTRDRYLQILKDFSKIDVVLKNLIKDETLKAGDIAYKNELEKFNDVLSLGDKSPKFKKYRLTAERLKAYHDQVDVGGKQLKKWIDGTFDKTIQQKIKNEIMAGELVGESYQTIIKRLKQQYKHIDKIAIETLVRTHIQSANNKALDDVFQKNKHLINKVRWLATLDTRCCIACGAMDGREFDLDNKPMLPNHPRCRCVYIPITKTWREMGIDQDEIKKDIRPDNFKEGVAKKTDKSFPEMFKDFSKQEKIDFLGPTRFDYINSGKLDFEDLVNPKTGDLYLIDQLDDVVKAKIARQEAGAVALAAQKESTRQAAAEKETARLAALEAEAAEKLEDALIKVEKRIKNNKKESAYLFDKDGNRIFRKQGGEHSVSFTTEEAAQMKDNILTHNHPLGGAFSDADVKLMLYMDLDEIRAVGKNAKYSMKIDKSILNTKTKDEVWQEIYNYYYIYDLQYYGELDIKLANGELTEEYCNLNHMKLVWEKVQEICPFLKFTVEEW